MCTYVKVTSYGGVYVVYFPGITDRLKTRNEGETISFPK